MQPIGITLALDGTDKVQQGLRAVRNDLGALGPASQTSARAATASLGSMNASAAQTAAALRTVPAQFTDIVVSLQSGQAPLTVLLQQGGQLKDMFGGIVPAAKALGGYMLSLITPVNLLVGGMAALGLAYYQGSKEMDAFNQALLMTGSRAGVTAGQLDQMARALSGQGYSQSAAAAAIAELAATGKIGAENMQRFAATAMELEQRVGIPVKNTVKDLAELGKAPVEASIKLNQEYGYLTTATLAVIKALQDEGRAADAASVAQQAYTNAMSDRTKVITENLGYIERAWEKVKKAASDGWNAVLGIGRQATDEQEIGRIQTLIDNKKSYGGLERYKGTKAGAILESEIAQLEGQLKALQLSAQTKSEEAQRASKNQAIQDAGIAAFDKVTAANDRAKTKQEQLTSALEDYRKNLDALRSARALETDATKQAALDAQLNPAQIAKTEAAIRKQFADKSAGGTGLLAAGRRADLAELQSALRQEQALLGQRKQQLDIQYRAGLVTMEDYYRQQRALIEEGAQLEGSALQEQLQRLELEKTKGVDALNVQRQIADVRAKLALQQIQTQNDLADADQRATKAIQQHAAAMGQLTSNYTAYVSQLQSRADLQVASVGMGQERAGREQGLLSIRENYSQQMRSLQDQRGTASNWTAENEAYFQERMRLLKAQQEQEVRIYGETYERIGAAQGVWQSGAIRAMEDYLSSARNVAQQTADAFARGFQGMEDALVTFVTTGKLSFTDLANSIVADITRIIIKQQISNAMGVAGGSGSGGGWLGSLIGAGIGLFGGTSAVAATASAMPGDALDNFINLKGLAFNAKGGVYASPSLSLYRNQVHDSPKLFAFAKGAGVFAEAGPEAIMPLTRGPDGNLGVRAHGGGGESKSQTINVQVQMPQGANRATALQFGRDVARQIQTATSRNG